MKQEKTTLEKIKSTSRVLAVLSKIARIFCYIGIGLLGAGIVFLMVFGDMELVKLGGDVVLRSPFSMIEIPGVSHWQLIFMGFAGITSFVLLSILFSQARDIFADISVDGTPFERKHVKRIRKIAIFYLIISLMNLEGFSPSFSLDLSGIVGALMFWCIALIFEYGCELQQQSDETL